MRKAITIILLIIINSLNAQQRLDSITGPSNNTYKMEMNYDGNNNCLSVIEKHRNTINDPWEGTDGIYCSYNNGVAESNIIREWHYRNKTIYTYSNGAISETTLWVYDYINNLWIQSGTGDYTYDSNGNLIEILKDYTRVELSNGETLSTERMVKEEFTYNSDNKKVNYKRYIKDAYTNNQWDLIRERNYTYNSDGNLTLIEIGANKKRELTYNTNGNVIEDITSRLDNSTWVYEDKKTYTYDNSIPESDLLLPNHCMLRHIFNDEHYTYNNKILNVSYYDWNDSNNNWDLEYENIFYYNSISSINSEQDSKIHKIYPNPTSNQVKFEIEEFDIIEIYNTNGKFLIKTNSNVIDMQPFKNGIYFYKIISGNKIINGKIIKE